MHSDEAIRSAASAALSSIIKVCGQPLTWSEIAQGFRIGDERILFANRARGIFKPALMQRGVLSVKTTVPRIGRGARYADIHEDSGSFTYRLQGSDPNAHDNRRLHESYEDQSPLIYFFGVSETRYEAIWPAFVTAWNPKSLSVQIEVGTRLSEAPTEPAVAREIERRYATRETKQRLHQSAFREMVLDAYDVLPSGSDKWGIVASPYIFGAGGEIFLNDPTALEDRDIRAASVGVGVRLAGGAQGSLSNGTLGFEFAEDFRSDNQPNGNRLNVSLSLRF